MCTEMCSMCTRKSVKHFVCRQFAVWNVSMEMFQTVPYNAVLHCYAIWGGLMSEGGDVIYKSKHACLDM